MRQEDPEGCLRLRLESKAPSLRCPCLLFLRPYIGIEDGQNDIIGLQTEPLIYTVFIHLTINRGMLVLVHLGNLRPSFLHHHPRSDIGGSGGGKCAMRCETS